MQEIGRAVPSPPAAEGYEMDALESRQFLENTEYLRVEYSKAIDGLNALWGMFKAIDDDEYKAIKGRLEISYRGMCDYWREHSKSR